MSDQGSSGLSELEEMPEEQASDIEQLAGEELIQDADTEAETERLEDTPQKSRRTFRSHQNASDYKRDNATQNDGKEEISISNSGYMKDTVLDNDVIGQDTPSHNSPGAESTTAWIPSGTLSSPSGQKRKRFNTLSPPNRDDQGFSSPHRKRSMSSRSSSSSHTIPKIEADNEHRSLHEAIAHDAYDNDVLDGVPTPEEEIAAMERNPPESTVTRRSARRRLNDEESVMSDKESLGNSEDPGGENGEDDRHEGEVEDLPQIEADGDEGEADQEAEMLAKNEDELVRKKAAMEKLMPIENYFAIFRDKLFDEKLADIAAELELLNSFSPSHPLLLAQIRCLDARRDEKVRLENIALGYDLESRSRTTLAERAQLHSQFHQEIRHLRESHISSVNKEFCQIQRERRQWNNKEPRDIYLFDPDRSAQILRQTAYNKEVSLLSGIARHVGFPAAPQLKGATSAEIQADLRRMKLESRPKSYVAHVANQTHIEEMAGAEQFLEKNAWARANPGPAVSQSTLLGRPQFAAEETERPRLFEEKSQPADVQAISVSDAPEILVRPMSTSIKSRLAPSPPLNSLSQAYDDNHHHHHQAAGPAHPAPSSDPGHERLAKEPILVDETNFTENTFQNRQNHLQETSRNFERPLAKQHPATSSKVGSLPPYSSIPPKPAPSPLQNRGNGLTNDTGHNEELYGFNNRPNQRSTFDHPSAFSGLSGKSIGLG